MMTKVVMTISLLDIAFNIIILMLIGLLIESVAEFIYKLIKHRHE